MTIALALQQACDSFYPECIMFYTLYSNFVNQTGNFYKDCPPPLIFGLPNYPRCTP